MNIGTISYDSHCGLAHIARDFVKHDVVNRVMVTPHPRYPRVQNLYKKGTPLYTRYDVEPFLYELDALILFETATGNTWDVVKKASSRGIKVIMVPMYEWSGLSFPAKIDLMICPSLLDLDYYKERFNSVFLTLPVDRELYPWKLREKAITFVHNAGHGQRQLTKGTNTIIDAIQYVQSDAKFIIRAQPEERRVFDFFKGRESRPNVEIRMGEVSDHDLYSEGDVFINAEEYNGCSLMLQEAYASGMLVITTDRYPTNKWLHLGSTLIPVDHYVKDRIAIEFDRAIVDPKAVAEKIDYWYGQDISIASHVGRAWAEKHSWEALYPQYMETIKGVVG